MGSPFGGVIDPRVAENLDKLLKAITENIETSTKQNERLGHYTFWLMVMTGIITICTIVQVMVIIIVRTS